MTTNANGLTVGIGFDVATRSASNRELQRDHWQALIARIDNVVDYVTLEDGFARAEGDGFDAVLLANWLAPRSRNIGIIAGAPVSFLEPFHVSTAIATLDFVSEGRAGLLVQRYAEVQAAQARRTLGELDGFPPAQVTALERDSLDTIEAIQRLWDSWEDGAIIRDRESQRFLDGSKLHYVNFEGAEFNILGPSITPRPPQGQPVTAVTYRKDEDPLIAAAADVVFLHLEAASIGDAVEKIRSSAASKAVVFVADITLEAGRQSTADLAAQIAGLARSGVSGIRLLLSDPTQQVAYLSNELLPVLRAALLLRSPANGSLRDRFALPAATNRFTAAA
ncbi:alkanesulfonate monooxygenase SsuD/methylene tetrahydromethanopterin reductase-like flavin-dependent oxidoreductase (luciferase family) [Rhizobium sp. BK312]|uniref:LLM class flavin-dependent oxidoreductase n=1 Tax=Rhizobium sp. BK312 TaxID=2587080 RepID=UPI00160947AE|nr:LLM class flavin-dependent oxidoreductase [Rhizobium sp. BK312]MBB3428931.1 alkanesulfonate monooxygenase SsuD/methylene tetrahydromethanopterin reductase-like flavin-dependent oxidoreductase (luciferase family) [Rhizobium sp. BK312]